MNKILTKVTALCVGLAMVAGVGVAVGSKNVGPVKADAPYDFTGDKVTFSSQGLSNDTKYSGEFTNSSTFKVQFTGGTNDGKYYTTGSGIRTYGNGSIVVTALTGNLTSVVFTWSGSNAPTADNATPSGYSTSTKTWTGEAASVTLTRPSGSGHWRCQAIQATVSGGSETSHSVKDSVSYGTITPSSVEDGQTLTATITPDTWYSVPTSVSVTMGGTAVASTYSNGVVTVQNVTGDIEISGSCVKTGGPAHAGTLTDPYTIADAYMAIDDNAGKDNVYVQGIVSGIVESWSTQYNNISFNISFDGATTGNQFEFYRCVSSDQHTIASDADIEVGATVIGYGSLTKHNSTYEYGSGCKVVSYTAPTSSPLTSISLSGTHQTTFDVGDTFSYAGLVVTAHYEDSTSKEVTPTSVSTPDMSSAGQKTVTVSYTENEVSKSAEYTITVNNVTYYTISFLPGEGSGTHASAQAKEGSDYELPTTTTFTPPEGKVFDHWEDENGETVTVIEDIDDDFVAYATWKDAPATTTLSAMFGSAKSTSSTEVTDGEKYKTDYEYVIDSSLSFNTISKVYPQTGNALKFGSSSAVGAMTVKVDVENAVILSVTVNAYRYHDTKGTTMTIGGIEKELTTEAADYVADVSSAQSDSVVISAESSSSDKRFFVVSVTIEYSTSGVTPVPTTYTVTYDSNGGSGTMTDSNSPYSSGAIVTTLENTFTRDGYTFKNWNTAAGGTGDTYGEGDTFTISSNTTLYAIWEENGGGGSSVAARYYKLVESAEDLVAGAKYLITNAIDHSNGFYAMSTNQKSSNRGAASIGSSDTVAYASTSDVEVITLGGSEGAWTLSTSTGYLYAASSSGNQLKTRDENSDKNSEWAITFVESVTSIISQGSNTRNTMQYNYNNGSPLFACYGSASQSAVYLYRLSFEETLLGNITCDGNGGNTFADGFTWNDLKSVYQSLPASEQEDLVTASNDGLERYDYLIAKYGASTFENFIGRTITPLPNAAYFNYQSNIDSSSSITIIVIVAVTSMTLLGVTLVLRKRKHQ